MELLDILIMAALLIIPAVGLWYYYVTSNKDFFVYYREPAYHKNRDYDYFKVNLRNNILNYVSEQEYVDNFENNPAVQSLYHTWLNNGWKN